MDPSRKRATIDLGSDDGLIEGQELYVYRDTTHLQFVGTLVLQRVETDWGMGELIASMPSEEFRKHDIVAVERADEK